MVPIFLQFYSILQDFETFGFQIRRRFMFWKFNYTQIRI